MFNELNKLKVWLESFLLYSEVKDLLMLCSYTFFLSMLVGNKAHNTNNTKKKISSCL